MQYLSFYCYLNAIYPFSNLLRALEILNSKRLVEFIKIFSFFQNLHLKNWYLDDSFFSDAMQFFNLSTRIKSDKAVKILANSNLPFKISYFLYFIIFVKVVVLWAMFKFSQSGWATNSLGGRARLPIPRRNWP